MFVEFGFILFVQLCAWMFGVVRYVCLLQYAHVAILMLLAACALARAICM